MDIRSPRILSICTGAGGLDLGVRLARPDARTVCYVEREAFAVANLVAAIQEGLMDEAPVWSDLATFDGGPWRGRVDWLIGGIPCQPHSTAGQRHGADDERDLWPDAARIIREVRPGIVFLENVPGIMGYYHERIGPELRGMGYRTEEGLFSAAEVGAPHARERFFVFGSEAVANAHDGARSPEHEERTREFGGSGPGAVGDSECSERRPDGRLRGTQGKDLHQRRKEGAGRARMGDEAMADRHGISRGVHLREGQPGDSEREARRRGEEVADAPRDGRGQSPEAARKRERQPAECGEGLADDHGQRQCRDVPPWARGPEALRSEPDVSDPFGERHQGVRRAEQGVAVEELGTVFPPGSNDFEAWARVLAEMPEAEPAFCREADGVAWWLDATANRTQRLRVLGNGVVPLVAAHALRTLAARMGLELGSLKEAI